MATILKIRLVKIGNSHGIRIPKPLIEQIGLGAEAELTVKARQLVIRPAHRPRQGWEAEFREMAQRGEDRLLDEVAPPRWDSEEWEW